MENKQIKDLMQTMVRYGTKRLKVKKGDFELELEQQGLQSSETCAPTQVVQVDKFTQPQHKDIPASLVPPVPQTQTKKEDNAKYVTSPMVGTFYISPAPEEPAFVKVGDKVEADTVICIVEAMKVMNEVKSGVEGTVSEILIKDGHPVEFGSKLFRIT